MQCTPWSIAWINASTFCRAFSSTVYLPTDVPRPAAQYCTAVYCLCLQIWQGFFFYYFLATWLLLNVWAIYGVAAYHNKNGNAVSTKAREQLFHGVSTQARTKCRMLLCLLLQPLRPTA